MFRCQVTGKLTQPGEKMLRIIVETRPKVYVDSKGWVLGEGTEIVKEICVSQTGYDRWMAEHPPVVHHEVEKKGSSATLEEFFGGDLR